MWSRLPRLITTERWSNTDDIIVSNSPSWRVAYELAGACVSPAWRATEGSISLTAAWLKVTGGQSTKCLVKKYQTHKVSWTRTEEFGLISQESFSKLELWMQLKFSPSKHKMFFGSGGVVRSLLPRFCLVLLRSCKSPIRSFIGFELSRELERLRKKLARDRRSIQWGQFVAWNIRK